MVPGALSTTGVNSFGASRKHCVTLIEILHCIIVVVPLPSDEEISEYGIAYAYDWNRQRQKANREKIEKYAKMKKRINKLSKKNRVVKHK